MTINVHLPAKNEVLRPTITVIGVGGAGGNAVNNMIAARLEGVNFVMANTDAQALDHALTDRTIQLGAGLTRGLGAGANPEVGRSAAEEAREEIAAAVDGSNMVFITAGMGGGTGTGAASVVARIAKEQGILTIGVVTKPFQFEGSHRMKLAEAGLKELQECVDTLIIIPNQNLFRIANEKTTFADAFKMADEVLHSGVRGVTDLMVKPGLINLDFADIRTVMREMGKAMMGTGEASGDKRAVEAAEAAISNPLLDDVSLKGARALLINITGGPDMTLFEVDEAANRVREEVDPDANIIFGSTFSDEMQGRMRVSVVATGIDAQSQASPATTTSAPKLVTIGEPKRPYSFSPSANTTSVPKPAAEPTKPAVMASVSPMPRTSFIMPETAASQQQRAGGAVRIERQEDMPEVSEFEAKPVERVAASAPMADDLFSQPRAMPPAAPARRYDAVRDEEPAQSNASGRGFFQRVADVSKVFSGKADAQARSAQVEISERRPKLTEEEQYLDIPAFLRRQAN